MPMRLLQIQVPKLLWFVLHNYGFISFGIDKSDKFPNTRDVVPLTLN